MARSPRIGPTRNSRRLSYRDQSRPSAGSQGPRHSFLKYFEVVWKDWIHGEFAMEENHQVCGSLKGNWQLHGGKVVKGRSG